MSRDPELGSLCDSDLDALAIVLGTANNPAAAPTQAAEASVLWSGDVQGDGSGPQRSYFVRLYVDGTAHCQCPDFYFRSTLRRDTTYACKHIRRARSGLSQS